MQPADVSMVSTASINQDKTVSASDSFYRGERFEEMIERKYSPQMKLPVATLRLWHTGATMHLSAGALGPESRWDNYVAAFRRTVDLGEEIVDVGMVVLACIVVDQGEEGSEVGRREQCFVLVWLGIW